MELQEAPKPLTPAEQAEARLSDRERAAYRTWKGLAQPRISPDTQAKFFALYLRGETLEDIVRINRGFSIGQLAQAAVEGDWAVKRDEYLKDLFESVRGIAQQGALESVRFIIDQLGAVHKKYGESARKFIQTGDEADFKDFGIDSIRAYKTAVEALQKVTGADKQVEHKHLHNHLGSDQAPVVRADKPLEKEDAAKVIRLAARNGSRR